MPDTDTMRASSGRTTFGSSLAFCGYVLLRPFKGFYEMKYEKRGTLRAGLLFLLAYYVSAIVRTIYTSYTFNAAQGQPVNLGMILLQSVMPPLLFCVANWCLTLMLNGEGTMPQIFMGLCYATIPLSGYNLLYALLTNLLTRDEAAYINFLGVLAILWTGLLVVVCVMQINQYSFSRAIVACLLSIVGIAVILLIFLLCFNLVQQILSFFQSIIKELSYR